MRGDEVASHGYRWLNGFEMDRDQERLWIDRTVESLTQTVGPARLAGTRAR